MIKIRQRGVTGTGFAILGAAGFALGYSALMYFGPVYAIIRGVGYAFSFGILGSAIFSERKKFPIMGNQENYQKVYQKLLHRFIYKPGVFNRT